MGLMEERRKKNYMTLDPPIILDTLEPHFKDEITFCTPPPQPKKIIN